MTEQQAERFDQALQAMFDGHDEARAPNSANF
jgi:hypothetical protein